MQIYEGKKIEITMRERNMKNKDATNTKYKDPRIRRCKLHVHLLSENFLPPPPLCVVVLVVSS